MSPPPADLISAHTLFGCVLRELGAQPRISGPDPGYLTVTLPRTGERLGAALRRASVLGVHRFRGPVHRHLGPDRRSLTITGLARLVAAELALRTGHDNEEFVDQVVASHATLTFLLDAWSASPSGRPGRWTTAREPAGTGPTADYLDSEQSLLAGHPRHPTPKWRSGTPAAWQRYAPELGARFPLRWLAVAEDAVAETSVDEPGFDGHGRLRELREGPEPPAGFRALPVHPWQFTLARADPLAGPALARAFAVGTLVDLGSSGRPVYPTASVRTLYQPELDVFLKMSLNIRVTNCLRKNARYELAGAVAVTTLLAPVRDRMATSHPGFALLPEPAARTVELPPRLGDAAERRAVAESLGVIIRSGLRGPLAPGETALLAGSLVAERVAGAPGTGRWHVSALVAPGDVERWWASYLALLVDPVLYLWFTHGVALEPHLQNVLVVVDRAGRPRRMLVRDLEGIKIGPGPLAAAVAALPTPVAAAIARDEEAGWNRVAYCLLVNHLVEVLAALADLRPDREAALWAALQERVALVSGALGHPDRLVELRSGAPLPAKANLLLRWSRRADRHAAYVPFGPVPAGARR